MAEQKQDAQVDQLTDKTDTHSHLPPNTHVDTYCIHADTHLTSVTTGDIAPPLHLTTTFDLTHQQAFTYTRTGNPTRTRVECVLSQLDGGNALVYSSGQAATSAVFTYLQPKSILLQAGYHGTRYALDLYVAQCKKHGDVITVYSQIEDIQPDTKLDLIWIESPYNPYCDITDLHTYSTLAQKHNAVLCCDATLSSPIGMLPLKWGVDIVMHSATKYLAGHSDVLLGVLTVHRKHQSIYDGLLTERHITGAVPGQLECYLLLRSLRTLHVRVERQSRNACHLAKYFSTHVQITKVYHCSLPTHASYDMAQRYCIGDVRPAVMAVLLKTAEQAKTLAGKCRLGRNATSLGGFETLIDYRYTWDKTVPDTLLRISVGLESIDDLIADFKQALD